MRFQEFKHLTPIYEAASDSALVSANALHTANYLSSVTDKLPEEEGHRLVDFNNTLEKIIDGILGFTKYFHEKEPQPVAVQTQPQAPAPVQ